MDHGPAQDEMTDALFGLLDGVARAELDAEALRALAGELRALSEKVAAHGAAAPVRPQSPGFDPADLPRGILTPRVAIVAQDERSMRGLVTFGPRFGLGKPHGGAIPLMMLDVMGRLVQAGGRPHSYTAQFVTDFRSTTPGDVELTVNAWLVSEDGRKRRARGELWCGERLCATAEGLFIAAAAERV